MFANVWRFLAYRFIFSCLHKTWAIQARMALWIILSTTFLPKVGHSQTYRFISSLFLYTSQMGAINHFSTICVYLIFISIYKPYGLHKSFQHNIFAKVWRSKTYRFILSLSLYTSRMGAINHFYTICLPRYGALKLTGLFYSWLHKTWSIQAMTALWIIFKYNMLAKCMALSNLQVYFIFISIFKPWWRYKTFSTICLPMYDALKTCRFYLILISIYKPRCH